MNWAAFRVANREEFGRASQNGRLLQSERGHGKEVALQGQTISDKVTFLLSKAGIYPALYLTNVDQVISDRLVNGYIPGRDRNCDWVRYSALVSLAWGLAQASPVRVCHLFCFTGTMTILLTENLHILYCKRIKGKTSSSSNQNDQTFL